ncbi:MAG TPA: phospho-N-acetylmuramoyl-pentapeptide-transferase [Gaiellaceae bacterium]|nr:phospho-N-acetylmuramoyl-pentapeptide-transferase [Gaiellaceae bacterium]
MSQVIIAAIVAMLLSILIGPRFIAFLRRKELGQFIREDGPQGHVVKQGTPTMGGVLIVGSAAVAFLALSRYSTAGLTVFFATVACAGVGFLDDFIKLTHKRSLGLAGRWKLLLLIAIAGVVGYLASGGELTTDVYVPIIDVNLPLSWAWYALAFFVIAGSANGANLTDGIDGLAAGVCTIALFTLTAMNVLTFVRGGQRGVESIAAVDMATLGAALIGGAIGFLWYNAFPAEVIMGDTGSFALGGAIGAFALLMNVELLLLLIGGIFVIEALSVMIQVFTFKYLGRRVFLMAPIHHHFEMKAWSETKIMVRFWILTGILCAAAFALYYRFFFDFRPDLLR